MTQQRPTSQEFIMNAFTTPDHGWRGLGLEGNHKRKWYTVIENEFILVTALVVLPGEVSIRHTHETGELNISYIGETRPIIRWNPPGVHHGGLPVTQPVSDLDEKVRGALGRVGDRDPDLKELLETILQREIDITDQLRDLTKPNPGLRVAIDVLFPPFKTTIDDPAYPEKKTVTGQWYD
jgi:hypothetical protein